jgi:osmoprotectant transport system ATP-binding protein
MIELTNVTKKFGEKIAVDNFNLHIEKGSLTIFIGPSGCGKTTTLRMINRLTSFDKGNITVNGTSINDIDPVELRRKMGYVIQEIGLFPHFTVFENIAIVPRLLKWEQKKIEQRVAELLELVTLNQSFAQKYPLQLSGGEKQRVGLARALAVEPEILLMDEPFGAIDPINRLKLQDSFLEIQEEIKKTIVFVTHDINEAIKLGDQIAIINKGKLIQYDDVAQILSNPANEFVENLLGQDRNLKALSLEKAKDYVLKNGFVTALDTEPPESIKKKLEDNDIKIAYVIDKNNHLKSRFVLEKETETKKQRFIHDPEPWIIERQNNIRETLSKMLEIGEKQLPVVNRKKEFVGIIQLSNIFEEVNKKTNIS